MRRCEANVGSVEAVLFGCEGEASGRDMRRGSSIERDYMTAICQDLCNVSQVRRKKDPEVLLFSFR